MSRRGRGGTPFSLFAFQDIITSVTGIMILVTLILALEVIQKREGSPDNRTRQLTEDLDAAVKQAAATQATVMATQAEIDRLRTALTETDSNLRETVKVDQTQVSRKLQDLAELNKLLAEELAQSKRQVEESEKASDAINQEKESRESDNQSLEQINATVQKKIEELRKMRAANRVIFNQSSSSAKTPWLVELNADTILAAEMGKKGKPQTFKSPGAFTAWAVKRNRSSEYFVLLIKPTTISHFVAIRERLQQIGFDVGFDLLKADQTAIDPELGAAAP